mmetsp:Transcript_25542/g.74503  ORF Transcript_25542/g.74503 Transcript_25542/m.74503 type:complete len:279 (-) Transcript_25542:42-878(-)
MQQAAEPGHQRVSAGDTLEHAIAGMLQKEAPLLCESLTEPRLVPNVKLATVHHAHIAQAQRQDLVQQDIGGIRPRVHEVELGEDAHSSLALGVNFTSHLKGIRVCNVRVRRRDSEDQSIGIRNVLKAELTNLLLNIFRLVTNRIPCDAGQVHQGQFQQAPGEDPECDGRISDALVPSGKNLRPRLDLLPHEIHVEKLLPFAVEELGPLLWLLSHSLLPRPLQLQHQRHPCDNPCAPRQQTMPNDALEHRRLSRRLRPHHDNLWQRDHSALPRRIKDLH